jgi:hypothetical protein
MKSTFSIGVSDYALFVSLHETAYKHYYKEDQVIGFFDSSSESPWGNVPITNNTWLIDTLYTILDDPKLRATVDNFSFQNVNKFIADSKKKSPITPICDEVYFQRLRE